MNVEPKTYFVASAEELNCPISHDIMENPARTKCNHFFDSANILQWVVNRPHCPLCRTELSERDIEVVRLARKPEEDRSVADRAHAAAAAAMPPLPSSALSVLPVVEVPVASRDIRIEDSRRAELVRAPAVRHPHHHHHHHHHRKKGVMPHKHVKH